MADNNDQHNGEATTADVLMEQLVAEFNPPLDEALIRAIASDGSLEDARATLSILAETAQAEEATGFDPSGLSHLSDSDLSQFIADDVTPESQLSSEFLTSISEASDGFDTPCFTYQTELSEEDKVSNLRMIFGNFADHTLKFELKGAGGDVEKAFEALLTRQFLEENGELPKGVDGFYVADEDSRSGKYTRKRQHKPGRDQLPVTYSKPPRLDADGLVDSSDSTTVSTTRIPLPQARDHRTLTIRQRPLAERPNGATTSHLPRPVKASAIHLHGWQTVTPKKKLAKPKQDDPPVPGATGPSYAESAAALRRKGPLYRQAAAYYDGRHREEKRFRSGNSLVYHEEIVASQSDGGKVDLHGVPVLEGVKIAKDRVQAWWNGLSEGERERRGAAEGITVITGVGYHSNIRGESQLRRAVGAMLKNDGWKFATLTGQFHVTGRV
ncbi:hypothetical protein GE09DRAFT_1219153 [Coniochaeta sp. 2T2.1]|nr:hypothetical protein GE09DRAFT_1219153 [Coniochaeta sp. 2T2.1]